jgi:CubicO group peptidase (beta-lactamase class C family)
MGCFNIFLYMRITLKPGILFLILLWIFVGPCFCQDVPVVAIKGMLVNDSTGEPLRYATIQFLRKGINTVSNEDGRFILKIPAGDETDSIFISHVGYRPALLVVRRLDSGFKVIRMRQEATELQEAVVRTMNPMNIIKKAIERIPDNYPVDPYLMHGFYRVSGKKENRIIHLSEAVFDLYMDKSPNNNNQVKLIQSRYVLDYTAFNGRKWLKIGFKPGQIAELDIVRRSDEEGLLSKEGLDEHSFHFDGVTNYNGHKAYEISFDQKDGIKKSLNGGKMFIDAESHAFLEFDLWLSPKGIKYWDPGFKKKIEFKLTGIKYRVLRGESVITYKQYGGKYYFNQLRAKQVWHFEGIKDHLDINPYRGSTAVVITGIDTANVKPFDPKELAKGGRYLEGDPEDDSSGDGFWKNYNFIQADFNVDSVIRLMRVANASVDLKKILNEKLPKYDKDKSIRIDSICSLYSRSGQFSGAALVQSEGKIVYAKGFGLANREKNIPNTLTTKFRIGSMSKQFTAMLIMQLVNENKISLDDTAGKFLSGYANGKVTVQQLLTHQSGIPNYTDDPDNQAKFFIRDYSTDELVRTFCSDSLEFAPGTQFAYSNSGYVVLADIIEKVTGKKYGDVLAERIFKPLGMKNSYFGSPGNDSTDLAIGYVGNEREYPYRSENVVGAGGITSTAEDLLLWANGLSSGILLSKDKIHELFEPRVEWPAWDAWYGYGWMIDRYLFAVSKEHTIQYHPGTDLGFYSILSLQPDKNAVVILLNNTGEFPRFDMTDLILTVLQ